MITEYETRDGHVLTVGRIPRQHIDTFTAENEPPAPPLKEVETWAGVESVPDFDDRDYLAALSLYYLNLGKLHVELIAPAVTLPDSADLGEVEELAKANLVRIPGDDYKVGFLLYVLSDRDVSNLVEIVFYNSTVTERGIEEAARRFNVRWMGKPVMTWRIPDVPASYGMEFEARRAARYMLWGWNEFCAMTGPEQSEVVCFYRQDNRVNYFQSKWVNK